jgi:hypothetical protein
MASLSDSFPGSEVYPERALTATTVDFAKPLKMQGKPFRASP